MKIKVSDIKPNPFRNIENYPIRREEEYAEVVTPGTGSGPITDPEVRAFASLLHGMNTMLDNANKNVMISYEEGE